VYVQCSVFPGPRSLLLLRDRAENDSGTQDRVHNINTIATVGRLIVEFRQRFSGVNHESSMCGVELLVTHTWEFT
jgi:hypothetical protein